MKHTIKNGDTFYQLAKDYNTTVAKLQKLNPNVNPRALRIGQEIIIKKDKRDDVTHTIKSGDTFWAIAKEYNTTVAELQRLNPDTTATTLRIGQKIVVKEGTGKQEDPKPNPNPNEPDMSIHKVKRGDTFWQLAKDYNTTVKEIQDANPRVNANALRIGMELNIPEGIPPSKPANPSKPSVIQPVDYFLKEGWRITSGYGMRIHPISKVKRKHNGIDFGGKNCGYPVKSSISGVVKHARFMRGYGNTVVIECSKGYWHIFAHAQTLRSKVGQRVNVGDVIMLNGTTGDSTGCHVHYQINKKGSVRGVDSVMNPKDYKCA